MDTKKQSVTEVRDVEQAFRHLQELVEKLPLMEERGARLARARQAREIQATAEHLTFERDELTDFETRQEKATAAARAARESGASEADIEQLNRETLYYGAMRGFRVGPVQNDENALMEALAAGGYDDEKAVDADALEDEEFGALVQEIDVFQSDYAVTLAICESAS